MTKGYWANHTYDRWSVGEVPEFIGWDALIKLIEECDYTPYYDNPHLFVAKDNPDVPIDELRRMLIRRDKALIAAAFSVGGRILEVLQLKRRHFRVFDKYVACIGIPVCKRWETVREDAETRDLDDEPPEDERRKWHLVPEKALWVRRRIITRPVMDRRNRLHLPRHEPLTDLMVQYVQQIPEDEPEESLFPRYCKAGRPAISTTRAYQIVRSLGERAGFHKYDEGGHVINRHVCPHWFRSSRASQLADEYGFREFELKRFFSWKTDRMASRYAKLSAGKLMDLMKPGLMELPEDFSRNELELTL